MLQPLADLKEKQYSPPYLKDKRACKSKCIAKTKVGEKTEKENNLKNKIQVVLV